MAKTVLELTMVLRLALNLFVFLLLLPPCAVIIGLCYYHYTDNSFLFFLCHTRHGSQGLIHIRPT